MTLVRFFNFSIGATLYVFTFALVGTLFVAVCALFVGMPIYGVFYLLLVSLFGR